MARLFTASSSMRLENTGGAPVTAVPFSILAWVYPTASAANYGVIGLSDGTTNNAIVLRLDSSGGNPQLVLASIADGGGSSNATTSAAWNANAWNAIAGTFDASIGVSAYVNGGNKGNGSITANPIGIGQTFIGQETRSNLYMQGRIAEVAMYNALLTDDEVAAHAKGIPAWRIRPAALQFYCPIYGLQSPEPDLHAGAVKSTFLPMTLTNSPTQADHAPVIPSSSRWWKAEQPLQPAETGAIVWLLKA